MLFIFFFVRGVATFVFADFLFKLFHVKQFICIEAALVFYV